MAAAMVSEGGSGSRRWSGALREIPGLSGVPCLARATSGTPSAGLRDIPDRTWLPQTPPLRPLPRTQSCQGPKFWGSHWVGGKVSNTASVGSYSGFGLRILWLPFPSFHFPALISLKSPQLFPPSLLPLTSRPCSLRLPTVLTSPRTRPHLWPTFQPKYCVRSFPEPCLHLYPQLFPPRTCLDCRYPEACLCPPPPSSIPRFFPNHFSCLLSTPCLSHRELLSHWFSNLTVHKTRGVCLDVVKNAVSKDSNSLGLDDAQESALLLAFYYDRDGL